jgi:hypothetical protein
MRGVLRVTGLRASKATVSVREKTIRALRRSSRTTGLLVTFQTNIIEVTSWTLAIAMAR